MPSHQDDDLQVVQRQIHGLHFGTRLLKGRVAGLFPSVMIAWTDNSKLAVVGPANFPGVEDFAVAFVNRFSTNRDSQGHPGMTLVISDLEAVVVVVVVRFDWDVLVAVR